MKIFLQARLKGWRLFFVSGKVSSLKSLKMACEWDCFAVWKFSVRKLFILKVFSHLCVCAQSLSHIWLCDPMDCSPPGSSVHGISQGKNTGVGCLFRLQGVFPTQGSNPPLLCLLHWLVGSLPLEPPGEPFSYLSPTYSWFALLYSRNHHNIVK